MFAVQAGAFPEVTLLVWKDLESVQVCDVFLALLRIEPDLLESADVDLLVMKESLLSAPD